MRNVSSADLVFITHDMDKESRDNINDRGFFVNDVDAGENYYLFRDRHQHFYNYLCNHGHKYDCVLITDSRDVVFQLDPFEWVNDFKQKKDQLDHFVVLVSEGFERQSSGFGCIEHFEFQRDVPMPHLKNDNHKLVCNAGVTIGSTQAMKSYELLMFMTVMKTIGRCTDQAALNYLLHIVENDRSFQISAPQDDTLCLTGEGVKMGSIEPIIFNGALYNPRNQPYYMIHQWDRLDGLREDILTQYN